MFQAPPLYILRHGETEWNATGRLQGHYDSALTQTGRAQAQAQQQILADENLSGFQLICSPQQRAIQTAAIAMGVREENITKNGALREIGLGDWAGKDREELIRSQGAKDGFDLYELAPDGEGFAALRHRCFQFLSTLSKPSILVTHGITSRMLRLVLTDKSVKSLRFIEGGQGIVFYVSQGKQKRLKLGA